MDGKRKELDEIVRNEDPKRILMARWVLKWTENDGGAPRAKARLVLQGFNDPDALDGKVPTASPTATRLGRQLVMLLAANSGWRLRTADVATAFLQGRPQERVLSSEVPRDAADLKGIEPDALVKLIRPMHGQVDAPRREWQRASDDLKASGLKLHPLDPWFFVSYDADGNCEGFILLYVDDMLGGGGYRKPDSNYSNIIEAVKSKFKLLSG
eukprot:7661179-Pyramimonas_sp.AAC.1